MANILAATACPPIQQPTTFLDLAASMSGTYNAPGAPTGAAKAINFTDLVLSPHATLLDILAAKGGANACCITPHSDTSNDLGLVAPGSGLLLTVKKGQALIGTVKQLSADTTLAVPDNTARVWIWLQQTGALLALTTLTPPGTLSCLLGSCVTSGGNITSVDTSGVLLMRGGLLVRYTGEPGIPTDVPPTSVKFRAVNGFCSFDWEGVAYRQIYPPSVTADPTSVAEGLAWLRADTLQQSVYSGGAIQRAGIGTGVATAAPSIPITVLPITSSGSAISWTVPSTLTEFNGTDANRAYPDLTNATQIRLVLMTQAATSVPFNAPTMAGQYSIDNGTTWNYLDGGTGPHLVFAAGRVDSGWVTLVGAAKASNVLLRIVGTASSGTAAVAFGSIYLQAK